VLETPENIIQNIQLFFLFCVLGAQNNKRRKSTLGGVGVRWPKKELA
jgi:hypothetical protein